MVMLLCEDFHTIHKEDKLFFSKIDLIIVQNNNFSFFSAVL